MQLALPSGRDSEKSGCLIRGNMYKNASSLHLPSDRFAMTIFYAHGRFPLLFHNILVKRIAILYFLWYTLRLERYLK